MKFACESMGHLAHCIGTLKEYADPRDYPFQTDVPGLWCTEKISLDALLELFFPAHLGKCSFWGHGHDTATVMLTASRYASGPSLVDQYFAAMIKLLPDDHPQRR